MEPIAERCGKGLDILCGRKPAGIRAYRRWQAGSRTSQAMACYQHRSEKRMKPDALNVNGEPAQIFREGAIDPRLGKRIDTLIVHNDDVLVYLDDELYVEWYYDRVEIPPGGPGVLNRVSLLGAVQIDGLSTEIRRSFRRMIGEALARLLANLDVDSANQILDKAQEYVNARNLELARRWYVTAAGSVSGVALVVAFIMWWAKAFIVEQLGKMAFDLLMSTCSGAVGATISLLLDIEKRPLDATAGRPAHLFAGITRIVTGMGGGALAALAVRINMVGGFIGGTPHPFAALLLIGAIAGASERLVPDLITRIEGTLRKSQSPTGSPAGDPKTTPGST